MVDIPLVRTDGKHFAEGVTLTPERFVRGGMLKRASKSPLTRSVEQAYALGDSLYFFAGHACPCFGDVVLAYEPSALDDDEGGATPFDTGGLFGRRIFAKDWDALTPEAEAEARRDFVAANQYSLLGWRRALDDSLREYFVTPKAYVQGDRPRKDDKIGRLLHPGNSRRAWTWEVRAHNDHPISEGVKRVWAAADYADAIRQHVLTLDEEERRAWNDGVGRCIIAANAGESPHTRAETEIAEWIES